MGLAKNLRNQLFPFCEFCVHDATLEPHIACFVTFVCAIDGVLDSLGCLFPTQKTSVYNGHVYRSIMDLCQISTSEEETVEKLSMDISCNSKLLTWFVLECDKKLLVFQNASEFRNMIRAWSCWYLQYSLNIASFTGNKIIAIRRKTKHSLKNVPCIWLHVAAINNSFSRFFSVFRREKTPFWDKEWCDQKIFIGIK